MSGKYINELTIAELRYECRQRELPDGGPKDALEIRLSQHFAGLNLQPNAIRFQPMETDRPTGSGSDLSQARHAGPPENAVDNQTVTQPPANTSGTPPTYTPQQATEMVQAARGIIQEARQAAESTPHGHSLESRMAMLESCMVRFGDDQRRIAETMRRLEMGMSRQTPEDQPEPSPSRLHSTMLSGQHRNTPEQASTDSSHQHSHVKKSNATDYGTSCPAAREPPAAEYQHADRSVRFDYTASHHNTTTSPHAGPQQSILIPYDDVRTARYSLPEFHGTTPEDPVRFIHKAESILYQSRIDRTGWTNIIEPQLKGAASTWWNAIRLLDLTWDEFRAEFLEKFDNVDIQSRLRAEIVSVRQTPTQSLTEFVIQKNQLARRINTGLPEPQLVSTIAGLTRNEYRTHIRLQRPATFGDLRRIAGILEYTPDEPPPRPQPKPELRKNGNTTRPPQQPRTRDGTAGKPQPPNPCRYCGGPHWNSDCPGYTPASGNGK